VSHLTPADLKDPRADIIRQQHGLAGQSYGAWAEANPTNPDAAAYMNGRDSALAGIPVSSPAPPAPSVVSHYTEAELETELKVRNALKQDAAQASKPVSVTVQPDIDMAREKRRDWALTQCDNAMPAVRIGGEARPVTFVNPDGSTATVMVHAVQPITQHAFGPADAEQVEARFMVRQRHAENVRLYRKFRENAAQIMSVDEYERARTTVEDAERPVRQLFPGHGAGPSMIPA
jgi:hypothetical protein